MYVLLILWLAVLAPVSFAAGEAHQATVTKYYGKVRLFKNPSNRKKGKGPFVKIDSTYYTIHKAKKGSLLLPLERLQTGPKSKVKLVYQNGDQITVSASTSYEVKWQGESGTKKPLIDMIFGKIRGIIRKDGERAGMKVRSTTMVMGVRGTDFYVSARENSGHSKITVLRGEVEVNSLQEGAAAPSTTVPAGFTAEVGANDEGNNQQAKPTQTAKLKPTSKRVVAEIFKQSRLDPKLMKNQQPVPPKLVSKLANLETKAIEAVKYDIKLSDPDLYQALQKVPEGVITDADALNNLTIKKAFDAAPKEKAEKAKFEDLGDTDVYDKYFDDK